MRARDYKPILSLQISDLEKYPVWEFTNNEKSDDTEVRPIKRLPVSSLAGRTIGSRVLLANGQHVWAIIGNLDTTNPQMNEHFVTLSIERNGRWFQLARYHDPDYKRRGPSAVAQFLGLLVDDIFPISYDLRKFASGERAALTGTVLKKPRSRLTRAEIIAMAGP